MEDRQPAEACREHPRVGSGFSLFRMLAPSYYKNPTQKKGADYEVEGKGQGSFPQGPW